MARDLTVNQQSRISDNPYRSERLVEIQTPSGSLYYTTGQYNVNVSTETSGGAQIFNAFHGIELIGNLNEQYQVGINEIVISIGDVEDNVYDIITRTAQNYDYQRTLVNVYWLYRNVANTIPYSSDIITLFQGTIKSIDINRTEEDSVINIRASNNFTNFDLVNGKKTSEFTNGQTATEFNWGSSNR
jgi:hypothetical protein